MRKYTIKGKEHVVYECGDIVPSSIVYREDWGAARVGDWVKEDSKYKCVIEVLNLDGVKISLGDRSLLLGDKPENRDITIPQGIHKIEIDELNFSALQATIENKVDFFAAIELEKAGIVDMLNNVKKTNHKKFSKNPSR